MAAVLDRPEVTTTPIPSVPGLPVLGNTLEMAKDPAAFFFRAYRAYGPVFKIRVFGRDSIVIAGPEAATFMSTRDGRDSLRSKEFWHGLVAEYGATETLTGLDGERHTRLRTLLRRGFSREAVEGHYEDLIAATDRALARRWHPGARIPVLESMQYLVVEQLGMLLTGQAPIEYVKDIRFAILTILNVLVTKQRPRIMLHDPRYGKAHRRIRDLGRKMIADFRGRIDKGTAPENLITDIIRANKEGSDLMPDQNLILSVTGPYVAGLDTVANTLAACIYGILKHPDVLRRVQVEADALFAGDVVDEAAVRGMVAINGAIMEAMRLWPIAVAQMRTATRDFEFAGHVIPENEMIYVGTSVPHFMEEFYPDPARFDVDRYLRPRAEHLQKGAYSPFGRGPHSCLGQGLAEIQMAVAMARLFYRFELALPSPDYVLKTKTAPTPGPSLGFAVRVVAERHPGLIGEDQ